MSLRNIFVISLLQADAEDVIMIAILRVQHPEIGAFMLHINHLADRKDAVHDDSPALVVAIAAHGPAVGKVERGLEAERGIGHLHEKVPIDPENEGVLTGLIDAVTRMGYRLWPADAMPAATGEMSTGTLPAAVRSLKNSIWLPRNVCGAQDFPQRCLRRRCRRAWLL